MKKRETTFELPVPVLIGEVRRKLYAWTRVPAELLGEYSCSGEKPHWGEALATLASQVLLAAAFLQYLTQIAFS